MAGRIAIKTSELRPPGGVAVALAWLVRMLWPDVPDGDRPLPIPITGGETGPYPSCRSWFTRCRFHNDSML